MCKQVTHLHVHTENSLLDGMSNIDKLTDHAKKEGMTSLAITDHGTMSGVIDFYRACKEREIKPILGIESYLALDSIYEIPAYLEAARLAHSLAKTDDQKNAAKLLVEAATKRYRQGHHLLMLAKDLQGYRNLLYLSSEAFLNGFYYRPRISRDLLAQRSKGLIMTSGCLAASIPRMILEGNLVDAYDEIGWYVDLIGRENFFIELQSHDIDDLRKVNTELLTMSKKTGVGLVATADVHYVLPTDYDAHDTLLCIQTGSTKAQVERMRFTDNSYYLAGADEMYKLFGHVPEALSNTLKIAEMVESYSLDREGYYMPEFPLPPKHTAASYLRDLVMEGLYTRLRKKAETAEYLHRIAFELEVIGRMGFETYFLIVWDLCKHATEAGIWFNTRGSAAGSLVAYCLGITSVDPIANDLLFERFLNPDRLTMPDIDLDFQDDRRVEMVDYTVTKYGDDRVAAIITFGTFGAKASVRDVSRTYGLDNGWANGLSTMIPQDAKVKPIMRYVEEIPELKAAYDNDSNARMVLDQVEKIQSGKRHASTHAAGIVVGNQPLVNIIPLHRMTGHAYDNSKLKMVTQFPMETVESLGLLKIDYLGSATLTVLQRACELINKRYGYAFTLDTIPYRHHGDKPNEHLDAAFELLARGDTIGLFQVESDGMRKTLREMKPFRFEHIVAAVALYRPGPMDYIPLYNRRLNGLEDVHYHHPKLEPILRETMGIIVYQEQIMQIASELFGYSRGQADMIRKAVSKKKEKELDKHAQTFIENGPDNGVSEMIAEKIWKDIQTFADYGFNKGHASSYAVITVKTAFLKAHYPDEYMTALLSVHGDDKKKVATYLGACRNMGYRILPPDVNLSDIDFSVDETDPDQMGIRFGLSAIKRLSTNALHHIVEQRQEGGEFKNLLDFVDRMNGRLVNKTSVDALIKSGAMSSFGNRAQLLSVLPDIIESVRSLTSGRSKSQKSIFDVADMVSSKIVRLPDIEETSDKELLAWEREFMGLYVSHRPTDAFPGLKRDRTTPIASFEDRELGTEVVIGGEIVDSKEVITKKGDPMLIGTLEDWRDTGDPIKFVVFPKTYAQISGAYSLAVGQIVVLKGHLDNGLGNLQVVVDEFLKTYDQLD